MNTLSGRLRVAGVAGTLCLAVAPVWGQTPPIRWYPNHGDLQYNGAVQVISNFKWYRPGDWSTTDPGYEHDLVISSRTFFASCQSTNTLPYAYDDCPTAGVADPPGKYVFSFGSFHVKAVAHQHLYSGTWTFVRNGPTTSVPFFLSAQEVHHGLCPFDQIGCMLAIRDRGLKSGGITYGTQYFTLWWAN